MSKNKYFNYYFNDVYDESTKKLVYDSFKEKNFVKVLDCNNYIYVSQFESKIKHNDKKLNEIIEETKKIEFGALNWFNACSKALQEHLNNYALYLFRIERNNVVNALEYNKLNQYINTYGTDEFDDNVDVNFSAKNPYEYMYKSIDKNLKDILHFYDSHFCLEDIFDFEHGDFKIEVLEKIGNGNKVPYKWGIINKVVYYALVENEDSFLDFENGLFKISDYAYNRFVVNEEPIPLTTKQKFYMSIYRTINQFIALCRCNCDRFTKFMTLTFADKENEDKYIELNNNRLDNEYNIKFKFVENASSYEECVEAMKRFLEVLKKNMKKRGLEFYYLGVPEYQKNGNIHYHFVCNDIPNDLLYDIPKWLDFDKYNKHYRNDKGLISWKYGKSTIEDIEDKARMQSYISKYMLKSLKEIDDTEYIDRLNKRRYYNSLNLTKPKVDYVDDYKIIDYYSYYSFNRFNSFNDTNIKNTIYQVKKLNDNDKLVKDDDLFGSIFKD